MNEKHGFTKLLIDPESDRILGAGIVGKDAGDLISELALAIEMGATATDVALTIHPHPTLSETIMEAAEVYLGTPGHTMHKKSGRRLEQPGQRIPEVKDRQCSNGQRKGKAGSKSRW
jgi:hypothetical protein